MSSETSLLLRSMVRGGLGDALGFEVNECVCWKKSLGNILEEGVLMRGFLVSSDFLSLESEGFLLWPFMENRKYDIPDMASEYSYKTLISHPMHPHFEYSAYHRKR